MVTGAMCLLSVLVLLPAYLLGSVAPFMPNPSGGAIPPLVAGAAVSLFFLTASVGSRPALRLTTRVGTGRSLIAALTVTAASLGAIVVHASAASVIAALGVAGFSSAAVQPIANELLVRHVPPTRLARAFSIKQASAPGAALLVGLSIPAVVEPFGWRVAFVVAAALCVVLAVPLGRFADEGGYAREDPATKPLSLRLPRASLLVALAAAGGLCTASANALGAFLVRFAEATSYSAETAGVILAVTSLASLSARIVLGLLTERRPRGSVFGLLGVSVLVGAAGYAMLAVAPAFALPVGALLAFVGGWSWTGLLVFAVVSMPDERSIRDRTSSLQVGLSLGAAAGPLAFAFAIRGLGYGWAWGFAAASCVVAAGIFVVAHLRAKPAPGRAITSEYPSA